MNMQKLNNIRDSKEPIKLHPCNPHYFIYKGQPAVLVTATEHYGAVLNMDFDYTPYLDTLRDFGFNLARIFSGAYIEDINEPDRIKDCPLIPKQMRYLAPWKRSKVEGYPNGGCKFDLNQWDELYFERLKDFICQANERGIIVEYVLFCQMYDERKWSISPLNAKNNVNGVGKCSWEQFTTLYEEDLVQRQEDLVRKVVRELNRFDNVYFEICNEPNSSAMGQTGIQWHNRLIETVVLEESRLPKKHIIAVDYDNPYVIRHIHPAVSVNNVHYTWGDEWVGAMELLDNFYDQPRVLAMDETNIFPTSSTASEGRVEAWEAIIGGCAVYDHLSWAYTTSNSNGNTEEHRIFQSQLQVLKRFIDGYDYISMAADKSIIAGGVYEDAHVSALVEEGRQYAVYIHHGKRNRKLKDSGYEVTESTHELNLGLWIPEGKYVITWVQPETGEIIEKKIVNNYGNLMEIKSPKYSVDIALKINILV